MIDQSSIESLKSSVDVVDVVGSYIELKKAGANYKANCPFHGEKTPSFVVSPSKQIFHCFGCGIGGDAIKFVMEIEKLNYPEAIEKLASMNNFTLRYTKGSSDYSDAKRALEIMQKWYRHALAHDADALTYLKDRSIAQHSIEDFGVGLAPGGAEVMAHIKAQHIPLPQAEEAGIIARGKRGDYYARLTQRITFPIYSPNGALVGFGGRTTGNHPAKYINSPQTRLFNKSRLLYGYHRAKENIYQKKQLIVCEGYLDVIMFHQAGFITAVATLGTALTTEHLPLLRKGEPKVILAYDGDKAGIAAALKAAQLLGSHGFEGGVVLFPDGQDPADLIAAGKSDTVAELLRGALPLIPFVLMQLAKQYDLSNPNQKEAAFGELRRYLNTLSPIMQDSYVPEAASLLGVPPSLFSTQSRPEKARESFAQPKEDTGLQGIIKTLLEKPELVDAVLDIVDTRIFGAYESYFQLLLSREYDHPFLMGLRLKEDIHSLTEEDLYASLRTLLIRYYMGMLKTVPRDPSLSPEKKTYLIRKIKADIIPKLRKGEFVTLDIY